MNLCKTIVLSHQSVKCSYRGFQCQWDSLVTQESPHSSKQSWKSSFLMVDEHCPLICGDRLKMGQGMPSFLTSWGWVFDSPCSQNPREGQRCGVTHQSGLQSPSGWPALHLRDSSVAALVMSVFPAGVPWLGVHRDSTGSAAWSLLCAWNRSEGLWPVNTGPSSQSTTHPNADFAELRWHFS